MPFKAGRLGEVWLNLTDASPYLASFDSEATQDLHDVTTFKTAGVPSTYRSFIAGLAGAQFSASGYYDSSEADKIRSTLQVVTSNTLGQLTYMPAGAVAVGDPARLLNINTGKVTYSTNVGKAVGLAWTAGSTSVVGIGNVLATLASIAPIVGATPGGDGLGNGGVQTTTGLIAHLHVTACSAGANTFKLQDATTVGGAYSDIAGGAFTNVSAPGSQRLVVPGTIRQFVRLLYTVVTSNATFAVAAART